MAIEEDIHEIKKEIVKSHNLIIKTDNLVKNLSSEVRQLQKKQESYERKYWINSIGAYIIFAALAFAGVYIAFDAKVSAVNRQKDDLEHKLAKARQEAEERQQKLSFRSQQEKVAESLLRLKRENRDAEALKVAESLDPNKLSPVLYRLVSRETEELRLKMGGEALEKGKTLSGRGHLKRALLELDRGLDVKPPEKVLAEIQYQRGQVLLKFNKTPQAAAAFLEAAEADPKAAFADNALFMAAGALETSGDMPRALKAYQRLIAEYPQSRYSAPSQRRVAKLGREKETAKPEAPAPAPDKPEATGTRPKPKPGATGTGAEPGPAKPPPAEPGTGPSSPDPSRG
ncbi:MAG: hypothetical protein JXR96_08395 [Deltaproteobacteria bacterium]|nr:hypothetical protein [Deltaproteobacteria bacterium]